MRRLRRRPASDSHSKRAVRVLVVSRLLLWQQDEGSELWEQVAGMVEANDGAAEILVTDGWWVYTPVVNGAQMRLERKQAFVATWLQGADVVHVNHLVPVLSHLLLGTIFRLRGAKIAFSPMAFLTADFATRSWTHQRPRWWTNRKMIALSALRGAWNLTADVFVCQSRREVSASGLRSEKCVVIHWPKPNVPLLATNRVVGAVGAMRQCAPIAFVSRMDPWRKGIDRMCAWLTEYGSILPRPAVVLLAPAGKVVPPGLRALVSAGLVDWDRESRGAALERQLERCRGAMLLSRFDAQPRSLREALWLGLPILCTPECGFDEVVATLGVGRVVDGDSPREIQAAFESLADMESNSQDVRTLFDRKHTGRLLLSALVTLSAGEPRAPARTVRDQ